MNSKENILIEIFDKYPDVWRDTKKFRGILADYLSQDRLKKNLLLISVEEGIPADLDNKYEISKLEINQFQRRMMNASGCSLDIANAVLLLWIEAFYIEADTDYLVSKNKNKFSVNDNFDQFAMAEKELLREKRKSELQRKQNKKLEVINELCELIILDDVCDELIQFNDSPFNSARECLHFADQLVSAIVILKRNKEIRERFELHKLAIDLAYYVGRIFFDCYVFDKNISSNIMRSSYHSIEILWRHTIEYVLMLGDESRETDTDKIFDVCTQKALERIGQAFYEGEVLSSDLTQKIEFKHDVKLSSDVFKYCNLPYALFTLGEIFENGNISTKDEERAYNYYFRAAEAGHEKALAKCQYYYVDCFKEDAYRLLGYVNFEELIGDTYNRLNVGSFEEYQELIIAEHLDCRYAFEELASIFRKFAVRYTPEKIKEEVKLFANNYIWKDFYYCEDEEKNTKFLFGYMMALNYGFYRVEKIATKDYVRYASYDINLPSINMLLKRKVISIAKSAIAGKLSELDISNMTPVMEVLVYLCIVEYNQTSEKQKNFEKISTYMKLLMDLYRTITDVQREKYSWKHAYVSVISRDWCAYIGEAFLRGTITSDGENYSFEVNVDYAKQLFEIGKGGNRTALVEFCLGEMYENGWGVEIDKDEAVKQFVYAAFCGHRKAQNKVRVYLDNLLNSKRNDCGTFQLKHIVPKTEYGNIDFEKWNMSSIQDFINFDIQECLGSDKYYSKFDYFRIYIAVKRFINECTDKEYKEIIIPGNLDKNAFCVDHLYAVVDEMNLNRYNIDELRCLFMASVVTIISSMEGLTSESLTSLLEMFIEVMSRYWAYDIDLFEDSFMHEYREIRVSFVKASFLIILGKINEAYKQFVDVIHMIQEFQKKVVGKYEDRFGYGDYLKEPYFIFSSCVVNLHALNKIIGIDDDLFYQKYKLVVDSTYKNNLKLIYEDDTLPEKFNLSMLNRFANENYDFYKGISFYNSGLAKSYIYTSKFTSIERDNDKLIIYLQSLLKENVSLKIERVLSEEFDKENLVKSLNSTISDFYVNHIEYIHL